jgi:uncharacterized ferredoxin-like protein
MMTTASEESGKSDGVDFITLCLIEKEQTESLPVMNGR